MFNPKEQVIIQDTNSKQKKKLFLTPEIRQLSNFDFKKIFRGSDYRKFEEVFNFLNPKQIFGKVWFHDFNVYLVNDIISLGKYLKPESAAPLKTERTGYKRNEVIAVGKRRNFKRASRVLKCLRKSGQPVIEYGSNVALLVANDGISERYSSKGIEQFLITAEKPSNNVSVPIELTLMTRKAFKKNIGNVLYK